MARLQDLLRGLAALVVSAALVIGGPLLLITLIGIPIPSTGLATFIQGPITDEVILDVLGVLAWVLWVQMAWCFAAEAIWQVRDREAPRVRVAFGVQQQLAAVLVGAIIAAVVSSAAAAVIAPSIAHAAPAATHPSSTSSTNGSHHAAPPGPAQPDPQTPGQSSSHSPSRVPSTSQAVAAQPRMAHVVVKQGDSLWSLASRHLGAGERWREIANLNEGHPMVDGQIFTASGAIHPRWRLTIPITTSRASEGAQPESTAARTVRVQPGDTLSEIAETHLGDAEKWPQIFRASQHLAQPHGARLSDPDYIEPGWTLDLGAAAAAPHQQTPTSRRVPATTARAAGPAADAAESAKTPKHSHPAPTNAAQDAAQDVAAQGTAEDAQVSPQVNSQPRSQVPAGDAPTHSHANSERAETDRADDGHASVLSAPWVVPSLAGGAVLAATLMLALRTRRRAQFRTRRPGRAIALPPVELARVEKTMAVAGHPLERSVEGLDVMLRRLGADLSAALHRAAPVAAVELSSSHATVHLSEPADLPDPWSGSEDRLRWTATIPTDPAACPSRRDPAPFPLLATIGRDDHDHWWLLNLEHLGTITLGGQTQPARDLLRYISCELALAPWADSARIDAVGVGAEAARMNTTRVHFHEVTPVDDNAIVQELLASTVSAAEQMTERAAGLDIDVVAGRSSQVDEEIWPARLLLLDAVEPDSTLLQQLVDVIAEQPGRTGTSLFLTSSADTSGPAAPIEGFTVELTAGRLRAPAAGLDLIPVGLTSLAAEGSARVLEHSLNVDDVAVAVDHTANEGIDAWIDNSGAIRRDYTLPRDTDTGIGTAIGTEMPGAVSPNRRHEPDQATTATAPRSLLEDDDHVYVQAGAMTAEDLQQVAPRIPVEVCEAVQAADPALENDYQAWVSKDPTRPRLRLLGDAKLTAYGAIGEAADRFPFYTELAAYLASKSRYGATTDELVDAFGYENRNRVRVDMTILRGWLGTNQISGKPFLPNATDAPAKREHGKNVYQLDTGPGGVLVDVGLFERKKARAAARGEDGMEELRHALLLVDGVPFSRLREGGWSWMLESLYSDRLDHQAARMIADTATLLTTHYLARDGVDDALAVAKIGVVAAPDEDTMQLNLARAMKAIGRNDEADKLLDQRVFNRSDDGLAPRELSERTKKIIDTWKNAG